MFEVKSTDYSTPNPDPFNWPAQNRVDLMSLNVLDPKKDISHTRTKDFRPKYRDSSANLTTQDV